MTHRLTHYLASSSGPACKQLDHGRKTWQVTKRGPFTKRKSVAHQGCRFVDSPQVQQTRPTNREHTVAWFVSPCLGYIVDQSVNIVHELQRLLEGAPMQVRRTGREQDFDGRQPSQIAEFSRRTECGIDANVSGPALGGGPLWCGSGV